MFEDYDFHLEQLVAIKAVMGNLPTFRPDGKGPAAVQTLIDTGESTRETCSDKKEAMDLARGTREELAGEGHAWCVAIYPQMGAVYRNFKKLKSAIEKLPVQDRTPDQTRLRMEAMSKLWARLPNLPETTTPFTGKIGETTLSRELFNDKKDELAQAMRDEKTAEEDFEDAQGDLHAQDAIATDFITAALELGRSQFAEGTSARESIDSIPAEGQTPLPGKAVFDNALADEPGKAALTIVCNHTTSCSILGKGPGATDYTTLLDHSTDLEVTLTGLAAGAWDLKAIGHNSRGNGEESDVLSIAVI